MIKEKNLPNGWAIKPMTEVVTWGSGGTPKATESQYYDNGDIPWLIIGDLNDGVVTESQSKITELGLKNSSAKLALYWLQCMEASENWGLQVLNAVPIRLSHLQKNFVAYLQNICSTTWL